MTVRESVVEFPEKGMVLVQGLNLVSKGKLQSIGSGKTALGEAISRALVGVTGRYAQLGHYSYKGKGDTLITLDCDHKGKPLIVEMGFKAPELSKTGEALRFTYDGQQVWRDRLGNTRDDLIKLLTVSPELAKWTVYLDGDQLKFDSLSQRTSVELLMAALAQPPWTDYLNKANSTVTNMRRDMQHAQQAHQTLVDNLAQVENDLEAMQARLAELIEVYERQQEANAKELAEAGAHLDAKAAQLEANATRMRAIKVEIERRIGINAAKEHALEIERNRCWDEWKTLKDAHAELLQEQATAKSELGYAQQALRKLQAVPKNCPTCQRPWPEEHSHTNLSEAQKDITAAEIKLKATTLAVSKKLEAVNAASAVVKETNVRLAQLKAEAPIDELSGEYEALENENVRHNRELVSLERTKASLERGPDRTPIVRAETTVAERTTQRTKAAKAVEESARKMVEDEEALRIAEYWQEAFGPTGIPNMILRDAIGPLNETSRRVSSLMTGGCIQVNYATSRELASGKDKAELSITVDNPNGADRADGGSKGESSLTNLIVAETLAEVGGVANRLGYRWYDEVGANQDELVRRSIFAYLKEIANRYGILVFVVSHTPEAASYADYILTAEKSESGTVYRWD